jgi:ribosome biogenesis protein MAK21
MHGNMESLFELFLSQALMLLYQVMESRKSVSDRFYQALYEKLLDPELRTSSKHAMFLNVLFKALRSDPSEKRVMAFIKRLLQVCFYQRADFGCAVLYLISEVEHIRPTLLDKMLLQTEDADNEEHFRDINDYEIGAEEGDSSTMQKQYQPQHRNPLYAGADVTSLWELQKLTCHFHPSVSRFSYDLLKTSSVEYDSNPLQDFTLIRFLDRFVYKNPKKKTNDHGGSLMQVACLFCVASCAYV